jgi:type I restriction enzyme, S subunit
MRPGYKQTEVGIIPKDWEVSTIGQEFAIQLGKMLDAEKNVGVSKPYLGNKAVQWDRIDVRDLPTVPMSRSDLDKFRLQKGDLLVCEGGEVGRAALWDAPVAECYYQKAQHRLRPLREFDARLMVAILWQWSKRGILANYVTQTSIAHLPREKFLVVPIPRPPLHEQRAIAEALSDVESLLGGLDRLIAKKRDLKQAAMQQLLTGQTRLPGFSGEWEVRQLGDVCAFRTGPFGSALHKSDYIIDGVPLVNPMHIVDGSIIPTRDMTVTVDAAHRLSDFLLRDGDVIIGRRGDMGRYAVVRAHQHGWLCGTGSLIVRIVYDSVPDFIQRVLSSREVITAIASSSVGTTMTNLNQGVLRQVRLRLPTPAEQTAIAAVLSDMDAELSTLESRRDKTRALKQAMMQDLLTGRIRLV